MVACSAGICLTPAALSHLPAAHLRGRSAARRAYNLGLRRYRTRPPCALRAAQARAPRGALRAAALMLCWHRLLAP